VAKQIFAGWLEWVVKSQGLSRFSGYLIAMSIQIMVAEEVSFFKLPIRRLSYQYFNPEFPSSNPAGNRLKTKSSK
ncbi:MAG TPA: hypothetical protein PLY72_24960, partial [Candidatus Obscuribacter sp.]|nr:hypothetical protein [Candidatus Obscuribacter sp.]